MSLLKTLTTGCLLSMASFATAAPPANGAVTPPPPSQGCQDYSKDHAGHSAGVGEGNAKHKCWDHIQWAIKYGLAEHPEWYPNGTQPSHTDMQCALYLMNIGQNGAEENGHGCNHPPCSQISPQMAAGSTTGINGNAMTCGTPTTTPPARSETLAPPPEMPVITTTTTTEAPGPSIEWWGWVLIAVAVAGLLALVAFFLLKKKPAPTKVKRAIKPVNPAPPTPPPAAAPVTTTVTAVPTYYEVAQPVYSFAPPVYAAPQMVAAPVEVYAAPQMVAAPVQVVAAPQMVAAPIGSIAAPVMTPMAAPVYAAPAQPMAVSTIVVNPTTMM